MQLTALEVFELAMRARQSFQQTGEADLHEMGRKDLVRWVEERTDSKLTLTYVTALFDTTVLSPFCSEVYTYAHQELVSGLEDIEAAQ
ncbi:hypothetical protein SEA_RASPUTIA_117 [Microbacterium phage Rasputia]|nr:hypothetical protein SEA_RASPUTIA_117 [Microbacterium phage Rasputia]